MLTLLEIKEGLRDRFPGYVATQTGLSRRTVYAVRSGDNPNPTLATLKALSDYLTGEAKP
jgi:transcriptional regulator with XRE-family HTH domain